MRCVHCGTPLHGGIWQCDCIGRMGMKCQPPPDDTILEIRRLTERIRDDAADIARMRRERVAQERRQGFHVIEGRKTIAWGTNPV